MSGLTLPMWTAGRLVYLDELLTRLGSRAAATVWRLRDVEVAPSPAADRIHELSDAGVSLGTDELRRLTRGVQLIDGTLVGAEPGAQPWVTLRAVDGMHWDVIADDASVLRTVGDAYREATPLPE